MCAYIYACCINTCTYVDAWDIDVPLKMKEIQEIAGSRDGQSPHGKTWSVVTVPGDGRG